MLIKQLINIIMKVRNSIFYMIIFYSSVMIGVMFIFILLTDNKVNFIYNQF
jgi:hypothetical protein